MKFCENCGSQINDNEVTCPYCGAQSAGDYSASNSLYTQTQNNYTQAQNFEVPGNSNQRKDNAQSYGSNWGARNSSYSNSTQKAEMINGKGGINIQRLVGQAGLSGAFITSAIAGVLLMLMGLGFFILFIAEAEEGILISLVLLVIYMPLNLYVIGQIIFMCNAASKKEYLPTAGLTVMNVGIITMLVYEILYVVGDSIYIIYWISRISNRISYVRQWGYFAYDSISDLQKVRIWLWIFLVVFIAIMVLDIISYKKSSGIINYLKHLQRTEIIPVNNCSIYPVVINFIKAALMVIICIVLAVQGSDIYAEDWGVALMIISIISIIIRMVFYIFSGVSIISFNGKLTDARRYVSQQR